MTINSSDILETIKSFGFKGIKAANSDGTILSTERNVKIVKKNPVGGKLTREDYRPDEEELAIINSRALETLSKDQVYVFTLLAFDTNVDRDWEHFLAPEANGLAFDHAKSLFLDKPHLRDHKWDTDHTVGRVLSTWYEKGSDGITRFYMKTYILDTPEEKDFIDKVFGGVHHGVSVGFLTDIRHYFCDSCNADKIKSGNTDYSTFISIFDRSECCHKPGTIDEKGNFTTISIYSMSEGYEITSCPVPAQRDSAILRKGAKSVSNNKKSVNTEVTKEPEVISQLAEKSVIDSDPKELAKKLLSLENPTFNVPKVAASRFLKSQEEDVEVLSFSDKEQAAEELKILKSTGLFPEQFKEILNELKSLPSSGRQIEEPTLKGLTDELDSQKESEVIEQEVVSADNEPSLKLFRTQDVPANAGTTEFAPTTIPDKAINSDLPEEIKPTVTIESESNKTPEENKSVAEPVIDNQPPEEPKVITSGVPLEQYDVHAIKESVDKLANTMAAHAGHIAEHIAALNSQVSHFTEHKSCMDGLRNAIEEHTKCMKALQNPDRDGSTSVSVEPSASIAPDASTLAVSPEHAMKSEEVLEKQEELISLLLSTVDKLKSVKLLDAQAPKKVAKKTWAEQYLKASKLPEEK